jgi:hypothetical protein
MDNTKFKLTSEGIEISGSEEFVRSQLEIFKDLIEKSFQKVLDNYNGQSKSSANNALLPKHGQVSPTFRPDVKVLTEEAEFIELKQPQLDQYENVFILEGSTIKIIADVPGNSQAKRMINVILIYLWIRLQQGLETATASEIREFCRLQGEFDGPNFSRHVESQKKYFLLLGDTKNKTVRLIRPGIKEAERLLNEIKSTNK